MLPFSLGYVIIQLLEIILAHIVSRYLSAETAAIAPSPTAVAIWRRGVTLQSPATKIPLTEDSILAFAIINPHSSLFTSANLVLGIKPTYMKTPSVFTSDVAFVFRFLKMTFSTMFFPTISSSTESQIKLILGLEKACS